MAFDCKAKVGNPYIFGSVTLTSNSSNQFNIISKIPVFLNCNFNSSYNVSGITIVKIFSELSFFGLLRSYLDQNAFLIVLKF